MADAWKGIAAEEHFMIAARTPTPFRLGFRQRKPRFSKSNDQSGQCKSPVDANRIYRVGHSGGADYALALAWLESELYAAVGVMPALSILRT